MSEDTVHEDLGALKKGQSILERRSSEHSEKLDAVQKEVLFVANQTQHLAENTADMVKMYKEDITRIDKKVHLHDARISSLEMAHRRQKWMVVGASAVVGAFVSLATLIIKLSLWVN